MRSRAGQVWDYDDAFEVVVLVVGMVGPPELGYWRIVHLAGVWAGSEDDIDEDSLVRWRRVA